MLCAQDKAHILTFGAPLRGAHSACYDLAMDIRNSRKARLWIIAGLLVLAGIFFYFAKGTTLKIILGAVIGVLLVALGMEATQNDYDLGKLAETGSFAAAKIERDEGGNLINVDAFCNAKERDYNCTDFKNQKEAQSVYARCKTLGANMDVYGLDRDKDGRVCESLPE